MRRTFIRTLVNTIELLALLGGLFSAACAQPPPLSDPDEITIEFKHPANAVDVKKRLVDVKSIPGSGTLPAPYQLVENKSYLIETKTIDLGMSIITFKVPVRGEEEFRKVRILRRVETELSPSGYEWRDCTISRDIQPVEDVDINSPEYVKEYEQYYSKYFPNYAARTVACEIKPERLKAEEYFAVVRQAEPSPARAFTDLKVALLDSTAPAQEGKEISYRINFTNGGPKNIGALTVRSIFDSSVRVTSYTPSKGTCSIPKKVGDPKVVCFLGDLRVGETITLELRGVTTGISGSGMPEPLNIGWIVDTVISERPTDPLWTVNQSRLQPLKTK